MLHGIYKRYACKGQKCKTGPLCLSLCPVPLHPLHHVPLPGNCPGAAATGCCPFQLSCAQRPRVVLEFWILNSSLPAPALPCAAWLPIVFCCAAFYFCLFYSCFFFYNVYRRRKTKQSREQKAESGKWKNREKHKPKQAQQPNNKSRESSKSCGFACHWCCMLLGR